MVAGVVQAARVDFRYGDCTHGSPSPTSTTLPFAQKASRSDVEMSSPSRQDDESADTFLRLTAPLMKVDNTTISVSCRKMFVTSRDVI
jgi:hypothetical protein